MADPAVMTSGRKTGHDALVTLKGLRRRLIGALDVLRGRGQVTVAAPPTIETTNAHADVYEHLYESHAQRLSAADAVGDGDFDAMGRISLSVVQHVGLAPGATVVDFGCGTGRLAVHLVPALDGGRYIGIDISETMLRRARTLVATRVVEPRCGVEWVHQRDSRFAMPDGSVDMFVAFSVFTHMEHEDTYRYLVDARRCAAPGARFVFSCLSLDLPHARTVFLHSAGRTVEERWQHVRDVVTTEDTMRAVASMAGWDLVRWWPGTTTPFAHVDTGEPTALGQSIGVLEPRAD